MVLPEIVVALVSMRLTLSPIEPEVDARLTVLPVRSEPAPLLVMVPLPLAVSDIVPVAALTVTAPPTVIEPFARVVNWKRFVAVDPFRVTESSSRITTLPVVLAVREPAAVKISVPATPMLPLPVLRATVVPETVAVAPVLEMFPVVVACRVAVVAAETFPAILILEPAP